MAFASSHHSAVVIGGGPAGLMAAENLASAGVTVRLFDQMSSVGRKFLMAGRGGLNLTHSEAFGRLMTRYGDSAPYLEPAIKAFPPEKLVAWCNSLGQETFVGSSGRIFPQGLKASPLLRAWLRRLETLQVEISTRKRWQGWDSAKDLCFENEDGSSLHVKTDVVVLALGGASWPRLGSDGRWTEILRGQGVDVLPLRPSNSGFVTPWTPFFIERFEGQPLKPVILSFGDRQIQGELVITRQGIEGGVLYALSREIRSKIDEEGQATLTLDLRPGLSCEQLTERLMTPRAAQSMSTYLRKSGGLSALSIALLRETSRGKTLPSGAQALASLIKNLPLTLTALSGIERAISSAGGIRMDEIDCSYMLRKLPGVFVAGEMIDWEAPTGGYLLQATFSTAIAAAEGARDFLANLHVQK